MLFVNLSYLLETHIAHIVCFPSFTVSQMPTLFAMTIAENIALGAGLVENEVINKRYSISLYIFHLKFGYFRHQSCRC